MHQKGQKKTLTDIRSIKLQTSIARFTPNDHNRAAAVIPSECSLLVTVQMSHYLFDRGSDYWSKKINERRDIADGLEIQDHVFDRGLAIN